MCVCVCVCVCALIYCIIKCAFRSSDYVCISFNDTMLRLKIMWVLAAGPNLKFCTGFLLEGPRKHTGIRKARITAEN